MQTIGISHQNSSTTIVNVITIAMSVSIIAIISTGHAMFHAGTDTISAIMPMVITIAPGDGTPASMRTNMHGKSITAAWNGNSIITPAMIGESMIAITTATFTFVSTTGTEQTQA
jgi:hypothetical protein